MLGAVSCSIDFAVESGRIELGNGNIALVQRIEAVLVVIAAGFTVCAELPQSLPAINGNAASRRCGIGESIEHCGVDVGIGRAADLVLAVPGVAGVDDVCPVVEVKLFAVGAELVITVEHQNVLDNNAPCFSVILVLTDLVCPGRRPVNNGEVFILAVDQLAPAGLIQAENQVAVFVFIGSLYSSRITGNNRVVIDADVKPCCFGFVNEPCGTLR